MSVKQGGGFEGRRIEPRGSVEIRISSYVSIDDIVVTSGFIDM